MWNRTESVAMIASRFGPKAPAVPTGGFALVTFEQPGQRCLCMSNCVTTGLNSMSVT